MGLRMRERRGAFIHQACELAGILPENPIK